MDLAGAYPAGDAGAALRPGATLGPYPERLSDQPSRLEGVRARLAAWGRGGEARPGRCRGLLDAVNALSDECAALSDEGLREAVGRVRAELSRRGLGFEATARAFALVRAAAQRTVGMRHHDTQVMAGAVMLQGMVAEMDTGEGKTLAATLPAATAALAGIPVHVITVNDYLTARDARLTGPVYGLLGLRVGVVTQDLDAASRQSAYACDVTYCTSKQLVGDYLRDRLVLGNARGALRLQVSRLDASAPGRPLLLRGLCFGLVDEADSVLIDEARTPLILSRTGDAPPEATIYRQALALARGLEAGRDFLVDERERSVALTDSGRARLAGLAREAGGLWTGERRREALAEQALSALHLFRRDRDYLVRDGRVQIIEENTGRTMPDRFWERGLHQLIEAKEGCALSATPATVARMTYQRFFRRYLRLAGTTGTAREVAGELRAVYGLGTARVPTHRPVRRVALPDRVYASSAARWRTVVARVREMHRASRPVLVGTRSVDASEHLSRLLTAEGLPHQVLNARQDLQEAVVIAAAGEAGRITVATNMAGRGTDIRLSPAAREAGGLHVIASERNEARRVDRQLFGRCGRQGDPGSHEALAALEDELFTRYGVPLPRAARGIAGEVPAALAHPLVALAQWRAEREHRRQRRDLMRADERLTKALAFAGHAE
jgi:preprotein translocase subunit SecA